MKTPLSCLLFLLLMGSPTLAQCQFTYTTNGGAITITGYSGPGGSVTIPATINSLPVTSIGELAFEENTNLSSVIIGTNVTSVGAGAFFEDTAMSSVTIPGSISNIEAFTFQGCTGLTNVTLTNGVTSIISDAFYNCCSASRNSGRKTS